MFLGIIVEFKINIKLIIRTHSIHIQLRTLSKQIKNE